MRTIYLDNAAATPVDPAVVRAMNRAAKFAGNPSSFNDAGRQAQAMMQKARKTIADFLRAREHEVIFCASGSEANALALAWADHIITQQTEHRSVLQSAGARADFVSVDGSGKVKAEDIINSLDAKTQVVSIMYANNEIGTVQDIGRIGRAITDWRRKHRSKYPLFHVDACQASAYLDMNVQNLGADLLTFNGSKVYGPRGIAVLYVRRGVQLQGQVLGGSQEFGLRAGTENVPAICGLAVAVTAVRKTDGANVAKLRDYFFAKLPAVMPDAHVNGPFDDHRLANNINISIPGADSENLLLELDKHGISAGSGSACTAHSVEPSHVLKAIKTPKRYLDGALRFSLSKHTKKSDIDYLLKVLPIVVETVRNRNRQR